MKCACQYSGKVCCGFGQGQELACQPLKVLANEPQGPPEDICLSCGLCCNGVIFADVKLLPHEDAERLVGLGIPLGRTRGKKADDNSPTGWKFLQPCAAFDGCRCCIYSSRPSHCRHFECLLLKELKTGAVSRAEALSVIRRARGQARKVGKLLAALEDRNPGQALAKRYRLIARQLERVELNRHQAETFGKLTVAFHELNLTLQGLFYPMPGQ